jgi:CPA1 family monovalent cation:H+ antiporter
VWVFPGTRLSYWCNRHIFKRRVSRAPAKQVFVVGWTGMRGVVSLAGALALPVVLMDGSPFPHRDAIVLLTFCVIFVTLVLQGLTLPPLIRWLGLAGADGPNCEELEARRIVTQAAVAHLTEAREQDELRAEELYDDLIHHYENHLASLHDGDLDAALKHNHFVELSLETLRVERETAIRLRNEGRINDTVLRRIQRELDLSESRFTVAGESD